MHIAIDARIVNTTTGRYVDRLLYYLQKIDKKNRYTVLLQSKDVSFWQPSAANFTVVVADFNNYSFAEQIGFKKLLDQLSPDLVHFTMPQQPILYRGRHVTTIHDLTQLKTYNSDKNWFIYHAKQVVAWMVFYIIARTSKQILVPTDYTKNEVIKTLGIPASKVVRTYESADIFTNKLMSYKHPFKEYILYVGQQSDYKNIKRLGDAHQKLLKTRPDLGLILVGRLTASALKNKQYFDKKGYKNIHFTGFVEDPQRDWLFTHCAAYIFASLMEGFGLPGLEAMGYGAPVVSSDATCLPEVYSNAAYYFNPTRTEDIVRAIGDVLDDQSLRDELITKGYKQLKKYSWKRMAQQTKDVYMKALE